ncbi:hypothetical protein [Flammeovirga sp. SJP92]|uniref:hypothetical protein n=1 Tax=Flammeovirga sp. SJP92 TaxID=1775430 RepID=UPI00078899EE|nr:hypothetical protein [Flammeovirga sp. SJP92]KXX69824.1 hypothetical protein AVL50_13115 [Flammeovirga sp. SJP92]
MRRNFNAYGVDLNSLIKDLEKQCLHFQKNISSQSLEIAILSPTGKTELQLMESAKLMEVLTKYFEESEMDFTFGSCEGNEYCVDVNW